MQIESYRSRLEEFEQNLNRELYEFRSGLKEKLEIVSVYADYSDFFCIENIREIESALKDESFESRRKSLEKILLFLIDQYLDFHTAPVRQELASFERDQTLIWEGRKISVSQIRSRLKSEPDALTRRKLNERYAEALSESGGLREREIAQLRSAAADLGFKNYTEARERISRVQYEKLSGSFEEVLKRIEDKYLERLRLSFETTLGIAFQEAGSWDLAHWEWRNDEPQLFPAKDLPRVIESAVAALRPERPEYVSMDLARRNGKQPSPCCIPIRVPEEIKIVVAPEDGFRHCAALLHETGHAYHFAWTNPSLAPEHRLLGDRALSEAYAFLLEHFLYEREWLAHTLLFTKSEDFVRFQALRRIYLIRRTVGKLRFALKLYGEGAADDAPQMYSETMKTYTGLQHAPESWTAGSGDAFASADYLRGWVLEAMLREYLRTRFGNSWLGSRAACRYLKEIWETGLLYRADELCREIGVGDLEPQVLADQLGEGLQY